MFYEKKQKWNIKQKVTAYALRYVHSFFRGMILRS